MKLHFANVFIAKRQGEKLKKEKTEKAKILELKKKPDEYALWCKEEVEGILNQTLGNVDKEKLSGIAIVAFSAEKQEIHTAFGGSVHDNLFRAIGAVEYLKKRLLESIDD